MRVKVTMPTADSKRLREKIVEGAEKVEDDETGQEEWAVVRFFFFFLAISSFHFNVGHIDRSGAVSSYQ